ncbi:MAG: hypothetical protein IJZ49_00950 [Alistipes sp.]|nr:hypothetical protein [Alistipes sp.]
MAENIQREIHPQVRLRNRLLLGAVTVLAVVNAVAGYFDIHSTTVIVVCNVVGVAVFVAAVVLEFMRMIPRKRWRALSFLVTGIGVAVVFCGMAMKQEDPSQLAMLIIGTGVALLMLGGICAVHWRRHSLAYRDMLQRERRKPKGNI